MGLCAFGADVSAQHTKVNGDQVKLTESARAGEKGFCPADTDDEYIDKWQTLLESGICTIGEKLDSDVAKACGDLCKIKEKVPTKEYIQNCQKVLDASKSEAVKQLVTGVVTGGCAVLCSGKRFGVGCDSCQDWGTEKTHKTRTLCGTICCNLTGGDTALGKCLEYNKQSCTDYK
jgi:hypothetical protein